MDSLEKRTVQWVRLIKAYFGADLGAYYTQSANRLVLYPFIFSFFLVECLTFWLLYQGLSFFLDYMAFTTVYSLHKAAVYTICILGADFLAHRLVPSWGAFKNRTVGRQWLIWSLGLMVGFILQRTMISSLVVLYAPDVVAYFKAHPQARLSSTTLLIILIPYWCLVMFLTMQVARSKQRIRQLADSLTVIPEDRHFKGTPAVTESDSVPAGLLKMDNGNGKGAIALADITHVTVEDHYCRINYTTGNGLRSEMIRLPLKEILQKLPKTHFLRIHRSHVVNKSHISRLAKKGRDHKIVLQRYDVELPVSRSRFKVLHTSLKGAVISN